MPLLKLHRQYLTVAVISPIVAVFGLKLRSADLTTSPSSWATYNDDGLVIVCLRSSDYEGCPVNVHSL